MDFAEWMRLIASVVAGLGTAIPLVISLVKYVKQLAKEKNWDKLLEMVMQLMKTAESKFDTGEERREWVLLSIKAAADTIDYDIDMTVVEDMIYSLCEMSKVVNAKKSTQDEKESGGLSD